MPFPRSQRRHMPSISLVLTQVLPLEEPVELLNLSDFRHASRREFRVAFQPKDDDPLMKTVDTRFSASSLYDIEYATKNIKSPKATTVHVREVTGSSSCSSSVSSTDDEYDTASLASTTELDLNREFEAELDFDDTDTDTDTVFEGEIEDTGAAPPLHRQPAALASLAQVPSPPPPRYWALEEQKPHSIPKHDSELDAAHVRSGPQGGNKSKLPSSLWRRVKQASSLLLRPVKKARSAPLPATRKIDPNSQL